MTRRNKTLPYLITLAIALVLTACANNSFQRLTFTPDGNSLRLRGVIDAHALDAFDEALQAHPNVEQLIFDFVPGSVDDDSNLALARQVRTLKLKTIIPQNGLTASGGTDLFLAGLERTIASSACVGVHTWGDERGGIGSQLSKDHPLHQIYLDFYREMEIPEAFYWFTLDAAGPDDSHWMAINEMALFNMTTKAVKPLKGDTPIERQARCEERFDQGFQEPSTDQ